MKKFGFMMLLVMLLMITACSTNADEQDVNPDKNDERNEQVNNEDQVDNQTENAESDAQGEANDSNGQAAGPYHLEHDGIDEQRLADVLGEFPVNSAERIITTSVPIAEMLDLLNIIPVGVPTSTNPLPERFESIEQIGSPMQPDLEIVVNLQSDLLIGANSLRSTLEQNLESIELERVYLPTESFNDLKLSFKALGTYFNKTEEMESVLETILQKENELIKRAEGQELPSVMLMIGTSDSFMVMSEGSYLGSLVNLLGAENIASTVLNATSTYSPMDLEQIVTADPDVILVLASGDHGASVDMFNKEVEDNDVWTKLSAYQNERIHILDYSTFGVTSIRNVEKALDQIAEYFYE